MKMLTVVLNAILLLLGTFAIGKELISRIPQVGFQWVTNPLDLNLGYLIVVVVCLGVWFPYVYRLMKDPSRLTQLSTIFKTITVLALTVILGFVAWYIGFRDSIKFSISSI